MPYGLAQRRVPLRYSTSPHWSDSSTRGVLQSSPGTPPPHKAFRAAHTACLEKRKTACDALPRAGCAENRVVRFGLYAGAVWLTHRCALDDFLLPRWMANPAWPMRCCAAGVLQLHTSFVGDIAQSTAAARIDGARPLQALGPLSCSAFARCPKHVRILLYSTCPIFDTV